MAGHLAELVVALELVFALGPCSSAGRRMMMMIAAFRNIDIIYHEFLDYDESDLKENIVL